MKIEHIIEDIKEDVITLSNLLEIKMKQQYPGLDFSFALPGIEEMTTIKSIVMHMMEQDIQYRFIVLIHTHNGNRVFEEDAIVLKDGLPVNYLQRHPVHQQFVSLLRDIIKRKKHRLKSGKKNSGFSNGIRQYSKTG